VIYRERAVGRRRGGGRKIFMVTCEVFDDQEKLIAMGEGTFRYRSGSENPEGVPASRAGTPPQA
jgi:hypothetical protein